MGRFLWSYVVVTWRLTQVHPRGDREAESVSQHPDDFCLLVSYVEKQLRGFCLFRLKEKHGNDWATIGAALGRSASSVKDRCRLMKDTCNTGETGGGR